MNIEKFILPISNDENKILGKMSAPLSCNKLVISSNFKLNNESYFGNGYNITSLMNSISNNSDNFTQFNNYTNFNYILTFGINSNKIEDIVVSMIIIDKDENIINLDFNINSLKDPNVYYNLSFKNDSSDLQNLLELDTKFSLKIPLEYKNNNFDLKNSTIQYFEGKFVLYKDKILSLNDPQKLSGNKVTNKQFFIPNNINQIRNFDGNTTNGNINLGKIKNSGKVKSIRIRGILSNYDTEDTNTDITLNIGDKFSKNINITPNSQYLQTGNIVSIITKNNDQNVYLTNKDNKILYSNEGTENNSKWIITNTNNLNFIYSGEIVTISAYDTNLQLLSNCEEKNTYPREYRDANGELGTCPDGWMYTDDFVAPNGYKSHQCTSLEVNKPTKCADILSFPDKYNSTNKLSWSEHCGSKWTNTKILNKGEIAPNGKCNDDETFCENTQQCYKNCNKKYHIEGNDNCSLNCVYDENPLELGYTENNKIKWKIEKFNKNYNNEYDITDFLKVIVNFHKIKSQNTNQLYTNNGKITLTIPEFDSSKLVKFTNGDYIDYRYSISCVIKGDPLLEACTIESCVYYYTKNINSLRLSIQLKRPAYPITLNNGEVISSEYGESGSDKFYNPWFNVNAINLVLTDYNGSYSLYQSKPQDYTYNLINPNNPDRKIKKDDLLMITSLNNNCPGSLYAFLNTTDNSNVVISQYSSNWNFDIKNGREIYLKYDLEINERVDINDKDDIIISSNSKTFTLSNLNVQIEVDIPSFIKYNGKEIFSYPNWFSLTRNSLFSYTYEIDDIELHTGTNIYINFRQLMKYFITESISEFSPFPLFSIDNFNFEFWGYVNSNADDKNNYDIFNQFCKKDIKRSLALPSKRSIIKSNTDGKKLPIKNVDGINYYDVIYLDETVPDDPKNVIEIFVPEDAISIAHDACKLLQAAYNLEAAYIFTSKTLCPTINYSKGVIQKKVPVFGENNITTYGCWNRASGCQADDECSGITTDEHINHKDASYGRGAGWIPDVRCPNRSCSNRQGIGFASWCDNSPTVPWDLNICSSDKDCGKDGEQWGGFCYPKCRDGYDNFGCCICQRMKGVDDKEYDRVKYCVQDQSLFHEFKSSSILGDPNSYRTVIGKPQNIPSDGTGRDGQYSCAADNARVNNLNEIIRNVGQVGKEGAPCKCQNPYTIPGKSHEPNNATWNILPDRLVWKQV